MKSASFWSVHGDRDKRSEIKGRELQVYGQRSALELENLNMKSARVVRLFSLVTLFAMFAAGAAAQEKCAAVQEKKEEPVKNHYQNIEVADFDVKDGVKLPPDYIKPMMDEIVSRLGDMKKFKQVLRASDTLSDSAAPTLKLTGTVRLRTRSTRSSNLRGINEDEDFDDDVETP